MRQWMVDPKIMCRKHLLGEHVEHHMFIGTLNRGISVAGYLRDNLLEPASLHSRHAELAAEMARRGYSHKSPLPVWTNYNLTDDDYWKQIDQSAALFELLRRCPECRKRHAQYYPDSPLNALTAGLPIAA